jgi:acyl-coenzyme A thioesterase PaaI-like protein
VTSHFLRDLGTAQVLLDKSRAVLTAPVSDAVRNGAGSAALGVLVTLVDIATSDPAMASCPDDWLATRDLVLHTASPVTAGPVVVDARLTRVGSTGVVVDTTVYDGNGCEDLHELAAAIDRGALVAAATGLVTFARITRLAAPEMGHYSPGDWIGEVRRTVGDATATSPVYDRLGARVAAPGALELDCSPYVVNSIGTVTGGAQAALAELAALSVVPGQEAMDMQLHFLAQLRVGPLKTRSVVVRRAPDHSVVSVRLLDAGDDDRLLTVAMVTTQA